MSLPRWVIALYIAVALALAVTTQFVANKLEDAQRQISELVSQRDTANAIAQIRAESAERDFKVALAAAKTNHAESVRLLNIPTPPPEERCKAASELVDEVIQKERQ